MSAKKNHVLQLALDTANGVQALRGVRLHIQCAMLIYSAIDTLAWARKAAGDVTRQDFFGWVNDYMNPVTTLRCSAQDLYGARCALLHSGSAESKMSRLGQATEIWYAVNDANVAALQRFIARKGVKAMVVSIPDLLESFVNGASAFSEAIKNDPTLDATVQTRVLKWLTFAPAPPKK